jgi:quercetin dioxygenase-like cupin family protein
MSNAENATPASKQIVHEGPSVSIPAGEISFINTGVKTDKGELRAGPAYGDLRNGRHGTFVRMPAGFKSPVHTHTEDYFAVVVEGVGSNHPVDAEAEPLPKGSYWFQRGEEAHVTECLSETDCLFFIVQPGKFDYVIEQPTGKK